MTKENPWEGGPDISEEEFQKHLNEIKILHEEKEKPKTKYYTLGPDDDIIEFFDNLFKGANTK